MTNPNLEALWFNRLSGIQSQIQYLEGPLEKLYKMAAQLRKDAKTDIQLNDFEVLDDMLMELARACDSLENALVCSGFINLEEDRLEEF